jgi:fibronectin-binding autotransporter adhesin
MKKLSLSLSFLVLGVVSAVQADTYTYTGATGGIWSVPANWFDGTTAMTGSTYPSAGTDTATDAIASGNQTVVYDTGSSGTLGTLNLTDSGASGTNEVDVQRNLGLSSGANLTAGNGARTLLFLDAYASGVAITLTDANLTLGTGDILEMSSFTPAGTQAGATLTGNLIINSGGTLNVDRDQGLSTAPIDTISGTLTMGTGGTINLGTGSGSNTAGAERLTVNGNVNITGGTITSTLSGGIFLGGASNIFTGVTLPSVGITLQGTGVNATQTFTTDQAITGGITLRNNGNTLKTVSGTTVSAFTFLEGTQGASDTFQLGSNLTTTTTGSGVAVANFSLGGTYAGYVVDTNGKTLDLTASTGGFTPNNGTSGTSGQSANWSLINSAGAGTIGTVKATVFNLDSAYSTAVGPNTMLNSTGSSGTNNLGTLNTTLAGSTTATAIIDPTSTFAYTGTASAASSVKLLSNRTIGNLQVQNGALQITNGSALNTTVPTLATAGNVAVTLNGTLDLSILPNAATGAVLSLTATGKTFTVNAGTLAFTLGSAYGYVQGTGTDTFSLTNLTLNITQGAGFLATNSYQVFQGFAAGTPDNGIATNVAGYTANIDALGNLTFTAVPEPSTWALMLGGLALLGFMTRARARRASEIL